MSNELIAEAILGQDAAEFVRSDIGRYILGRAEQEAQEAADKLARVSPWRRRRIAELQNQIWRANSVRDWLLEMIQTGESAERALDQQRHDGE
jgi:hypothetical protein